MPQAPRRAGSSHALQNDDGRGKSFVMAEAHMCPLDTALACTIRELTAQPDVRRAARIGHDLHLAEPTSANPGVQRLEACFLRGEARRERVDPVDTVRACGQLRCRERLILNLI